MFKLRSFLSILVVTLVFSACQKEYSAEDGIGIGVTSGTAVFSLKGAPYQCTGAVLNGTYKAGTALTAENTVLIKVTVTQTGTYIITTNTANGITFSGTGTFTVMGEQTIILKGKGTPAVDGSYTFVPGIDGCSYTVVVESASGSTGGTSVFSLSGAPGSCAGAAVNGSYVAGTPMASANKVIIFANVTTIGSYNISTTANDGISFSGSGTFSSTGLQPIELNGAGTPIASGNFNFTPGTNGCLFTITVNTTVPITDCKTCSYIPTCLGIKYTFQDENFLGSSVRQSDILSTKDTMISSQPYSKVTTQAGSSYYNCNAGTTTIVAYNLTGAAGTTLSEIKLTMLKANAALGATWTDLVMNQIGQEVTYSYTIAEKGIVKDVLGVTFSDVIHVNVKTTLLGILTNESEYYYANGIGLIEADIKDGSGAILSTSMLKTYFIP